MTSPQPSPALQKARELKGKDCDCQCHIDHPCEICPERLLAFDDIVSELEKVTAERDKLADRNEVLEKEAKELKEKLNNSLDLSGCIELDDNELNGAYDIYSKINECLNIIDELLVPNK
jgi:hypothetical protein